MGRGAFFGGRRPTAATPFSFSGPPEALPERRLAPVRMSRRPAQSAASIRSHIVRSTLTRAQRLSFASTSVQGARAAPVRSTMSQTAC